MFPKNKKSKSKSKSKKKMTNKMYFQYFNISIFAKKMNSLLLGPWQFWCYWEKKGIKLETLTKLQVIIQKEWISLHKTPFQLNLGNLLKKKAPFLEMGWPDIFVFESYYQSYFQGNQDHIGSFSKLDCRSIIESWRQPIMGNKWSFNPFLFSKL